jgi:FAD synthetase
MKNVMVFGTFDLLHEGHKFLINEARKQGDVIVVVAQKSNVKRIKGRNPRENNDIRIAAIQAAFPDVTVILGDETNFLTPLQEYKPDLLLLGYDQKLPPNITKADILCPMERAKAFRPEVYKSSLRKTSPTEALP